MMLMVYGIPASAMVKFPAHGKYLEGGVIRQGLQVVLNRDKRAAAAHDEHGMKRHRLTAIQGNHLIVTPGAGRRFALPGDGS